MPKWNEGDTCYLTSVKGLGFKSATQGKIVALDDKEALVDIPGAYKTPWLKPLNEIFRTEEEAIEYATLENDMIPSIMDLVSVQPMMAPTPGSLSIRYTYATNSTQPNVNQPPATQGNDNQSSIGAGDTKEEGDTGGIQGHYQVPSFHL
jgi:hypothetical protein